MKIITDKKEIEKFFDHKIDQIYPSKEEFEKRLYSGENLRFYIGADATGPRLHLGHLIPVLKMRELQRLGHEIIFLVGDFTARLGDPSDKSETRKILSEEEVNSNASTFKDQISKYIDFDSKENPAKLLFNSEWNSKLTFSDVIQLSSHVTVQQMLERDMFEQRIKNKKPIFLHEFLYPLLQGYDSVAMEVDGEFGGRDQTFNMLMGRTLLKDYKNKDKFVITTHFLLSADGKNKMSKSIGNCIFIDDSPSDKFGKVMSIPDSLITHYYELATNKTAEEIAQIKELLQKNSDPMKIKKELAYEIVLLNDGEKEAIEAQKNFEQSVQRNTAPQNAPTVSRAKFSKPKLPLLQLIAEVSSFTNSEIKRLIRAGAIEINSVVKTDLAEVFSVSELEYLKIGKKSWIIFID